MKCPVCGYIEDKVVDTRVIGDGENIRRRRECGSCGFRFTTYETIEEKKIMVIKRDKRREEFNREKLYIGINKAIEKRPVSQAQVEELIDEIEHEVFLKACDTHEIPSIDVGEIIMEKLRNLDQVAYIRFASVYRQFKDVKEFINEIKNI
jgi:transcriptional repressor NrdR